MMEVQRISSDVFASFMVITVNTTLVSLFLQLKASKSITKSE